MLLSDGLLLLQKGYLVKKLQEVWLRLARSGPLYQIVYFSYTDFLKISTHLS